MHNQHHGNIDFTGVWITLGAILWERLPSNYFKGTSFKARRLLLLVVLLYFGLLTRAYKQYSDNEVPHKTAYFVSCNLFFRSTLRSTVLLPVYSPSIDTVNELLDTDMSLAVPGPGTAVASLLELDTRPNIQELCKRLILYP